MQLKIYFNNSFLTEIYNLCELLGQKPLIHNM